MCCVIDTTYPLVAPDRPTEVNVTMPFGAFSPMPASANCRSWTGFPSE